MPRLQSSQILPCDPLLPWPSLVSCCGPHPIQDDGAELQGRQQNCTSLPSNTGQTTRPSESTLLIYISWLAGTPIAESKQSPLSELVTLLCFGTSVVERTPDQCQDSGITQHLPQKTCKCKCKCFFKAWITTSCLGPHWVLVFRSLLRLRDVPSSLSAERRQTILPVHVARHESASTTAGPFMCSAMLLNVHMGLWPTYALTMVKDKCIWPSWLPDQESLPRSNSQSQDLNYEEQTWL